jgi:hypothetical protein
VTEVEALETGYTTFPLYVAVRVRGPCPVSVMEQVALPEESRTHGGPLLVPSERVTVPLGIPPPFPVTLTPTLIGRFTAGSGLTEVMVVVDKAGSRTTGIGADDEISYVPSPP